MYTHSGQKTTFWVSVLSFYRIGARDWNHILRVDGKHLSLLGAILSARSCCFLFLLFFFFLSNKDLPFIHTVNNFKCQMCLRSALRNSPFWEGTLTWTKHTMGDVGNSALHLKQGFSVHEYRQPAGEAESERTRRRLAMPRAYSSSALRGWAGGWPGHEHMRPHLQKVFLFSLQDLGIVSKKKLL